MSLLADLKSAVEAHQRQQQEIELRRPPTFEETKDIVEMLSNQPLASISINMYIAFRETFHSGWVIWLGNRDVANLTPEMKAILPMVDFEFKAKHLFRLSLWANSSHKRSFDPVDISQIPDGAEIFVEKVTGLKLFTSRSSSMKMAQGNTSRVDVVTVVDDVGPDHGGVIPGQAKMEQPDVGSTIIEPNVKAKADLTAPQTTPRSNHAQDEQNFKAKSDLTDPQTTPRSSHAQDEQPDQQPDKELESVIDGEEQPLASSPTLGGFKTPDTPVKTKKIARPSQAKKARA